MLHTLVLLVDIVVLVRSGEIRLVSSTHMSVPFSVYYLLALPDVHDCRDTAAIGAQILFRTSWNENVVQAALEFSLAAGKLNECLHVVGDCEAVFCRALA